MQNEGTSTCPRIHVVIPTASCHLRTLIFVSPKATINQPQSPSYIISLNDTGTFTFQDGNVISSQGQSFLLTTFINNLSANRHWQMCQLSCFWRDGRNMKGVPRWRESFRLWNFHAIRKPKRKPFAIPGKYSLSLRGWSVEENTIHSSIPSLWILHS